MNASETKPALPALVSGGQIRAIIPQDFDQAWRIAVAISKAGMQPPGLETPEKVTIAIMAGLEVGLPPMQAIQSIAVINNRPSIYGDGALALVRASGLLEEMQEKLDGQGDAMIATCIVKRRGESRPSLRQFSVADAKKAGLWSRKGPWEHYPQRMLAMRARAFALRDGFADVLRGLGLAEEQADIVKHQAPQPGPPPEDELPDFGETVVEEAAGSEAAPSPDAGTGSSGDHPTSPQPPAAAAFRKSEAVGKVLQLAADLDLDEQERLESLDQVQPVYQDKLDAEFCAELFKTASKVAKGALKKEAAQRYLEGL